MVVEARYEVVVRRPELFSPRELCTEIEMRVRTSPDPALDHASVEVRLIEDPEPGEVPMSRGVIDRKELDVEKSLVVRLRTDGRAISDEELVADLSQRLASTVWIRDLVSVRVLEPGEMPEQTVGRGFELTDLEIDCLIDGMRRRRTSLGASLAHEVDRSSPARIDFLANEICAVTRAISEWERRRDGS